METALNRRDLLKFFSAAAFVNLQLPAAEPGKPLFFTKDEFAALDCLTDLVIPTDEHSPGAHEAGVAPFIDKTVAEAFRAEEKDSWRNGLAAVNDLSQSTYGVPFLKATTEQRTALLGQMAKNEKQPKTAPERFFTQLKQTTAAVYYSSSTGIHQDINYKGNIILEQYVGYWP
ncbi:MAG: gluconate 2-dehydrogenase subunit 3 family protein [Bryobacteraceae bacterium]